MKGKELANTAPVQAKNKSDPTSPCMQPSYIHYMDGVVDNIGPPPSYSHLTCKDQRSQSATPPSPSPLFLPLVSY
uniref:Uncharacterized protein n=1 Tax=Populus trichocarpa TaxID=3694 RepID=U5GB36_POPTR